MGILYYKKYFKSDEHDWVIFLHGAGGSSSVWFKQLREFRKNFNVLLVDLRGHGRSVNPVKLKKRRYSLHDVTEDVIQVMEDLEIEKAHFIGLSIGTIVIRTLADMQPERIQSMTMGGAIPWFNLKSKCMFNFGNMIKHLIPFMWLYKLFAYIVMPMKHHAESRNLFISEAQRICSKEFVKWYRLIARDMSPILERLSKFHPTLPTLYIMGDQDHMFLPQVKEHVRKHTNTLLKVITGSGHVCNVDNPDEFNNSTIEFILRHSLRQTPAMAK